MSDGLSVSAIREKFRIDVKSWRQQDAPKTNGHRSHIAYVQDDKGDGGMDRMGMEMGMEMFIL